MFSYRNARKEDFHTIAQFPQNQMEYFYMFPKGVYPPDKDQLYAASLPRFLATVIECDQEIAGYCNVYDLVEQQHCWLGNVIIHPKYRGKGAGKYLITRMMERVKHELNVPELRLVCHNTNTTALLFYDKMGFKPFEIGRLNDPHQQELAGIRMFKRLDDNDSTVNGGR